MPPIKAILELFNRDLYGRFVKYQQQIAASNPPRHNQAGIGNTCRRFHGTHLLCNLGTSSTDPCTNPKCRVCSILRSGFLIKKSGANFGWLRYGNGLYFSATSSKAYDYGNQRAIFVCNVVVGRPHRAATDMPNLTEPPQGMDSVVGDTKSGLNYDEVVVYKEEAADPLYLIIL